jgi:hypothetical protein
MGQDADRARLQANAVLRGKLRCVLGRLRIAQYQPIRRQPAGNPAAGQRQAHLAGPDQNDGADI